MFRRMLGAFEDVKKNAKRESQERRAQLRERKMSQEVVCFMYDMSMGMARTMSQSLIGVHVEGVWHTGVVVFGKEYFYGGGIQSLPTGEFARMYNMNPHERVTLGTTSKTQQELHQWLETVKGEYTMEKYDLFHNNCNNFSDAVSKFLLNGVGIPSHVIDLPGRVMNTPIGQMLQPMYQNMQQQMQQHMIPFSSQDSALNTGSSSVQAAATAVDSEAADVVSEGEGVNLSVKVSTMEEQVKIVVPSLKSTVGQLKERVEKATGYQKEDQRLIYKGQFMNDLSKTLEECNIEEGVVIHLVPKPNAAKSGTTKGGEMETKKSDDPFDIAVEKIKQAPAQDRLTALKTLQKIVSNVVNYPLEAKYRKIKKQNPALVKRLGEVSGAFDSLLGLGFVEKEENGEVLLVLEASEAAWNKVLKGNEKLSELVKQYSSTGEQQQQQQAQPSQQSTPFGFPRPGQLSGFPGMGGRGMPTPTPEMMQSMLSNPQIMEQVNRVFSNPDALQQMLNDPMLQQLMQSNPNMSEQMRMVRENPEMMSGMFRELLSNPNLMQGMMGGLGGGMNRPQQQQQQQGGQNGQSQQNDSQMTEEEMIQEAIRRSLQER